MFKSSAPQAIAEAPAPPPMKAEVDSSEPVDVLVQKESLMKQLFFSIAGLEEVSLAPILSPAGDAVGIPWSYQQSTIKALPVVEEASVVDGWSGGYSDEDGWPEDHKTMQSGG